MIRKPRPGPQPRPAPVAARWLLLLDASAAPAVRAGGIGIDEVAVSAPSPVEDQDRRAAWPIEVREDAIAPGVPRHDVVLPPGQTLRLGETWVALAELVNGASILRCSRPVTSWTCLVLDDGAAVEVAGLWLRPEPAPQGGLPAQAALRAIVAPSEVAQAAFDLPGGGADGAALRREQLARAAGLGHIGTTDPELRLVAGDVTCHPETVGRVARFTLPEGAREAVVRTRWAMPQAFLGGDDQRMLGVAVNRIAFGRRVVPLDHWSLRDGWHPVERSWRWTNGAAQLLVPHGARTLELTIANTLRLYPIAP